MLKTFAEFNAFFPFVMVGIAWTTSHFIMWMVKRFEATDWENMPQGERIMAQVTIQVHLLIWSLPIFFSMICFGIWIIAKMAKLTGAL